MYSVPGYSCFSAFCAECEADDEATDPMCYNAAEVSDDENSSVKDANNKLELNSEEA